MKKLAVLYIITFTVAFCSLVYELILGQTLSAFFGNTVLRYSVTIGLYLLAMGFGAMLAEGKFVEKANLNFMRTEIALTVLGGFVVVIFFLLSYVMGSGLLFLAVAHGLIITIGVLTGFEIPLLIKMAEDTNNEAEARILGVDYAGAFVGALVFAFVFYPKLGLIPAAFITGLLNTAAGLIAYFQAKKNTTKRKVSGNLAATQGVLGVVLVFLLINAKWINNYLIERYLN